MRIFIEAEFTEKEGKEILDLLRKLEESDPNRRVTLILQQEGQTTEEGDRLLKEWGFPYRKIIQEFDRL